MSMVIWKEYITVAYVVQRSAQPSVFGSLTVACQFCFVTNKYMYLFFFFFRLFIYSLLMTLLGFMVLNILARFDLLKLH